MVDLLCKPKSKHCIEPQPYTPNPLCWLTLNGLVARHHLRPSCSSRLAYPHAAASFQRPLGEHPGNPLFRHAAVQIRHPCIPGVPSVSIAAQLFSRFLSGPSKRAVVRGRRYKLTRTHYSKAARDVKRAETLDAFFASTGGPVTLSLI